MGSFFSQLKLAIDAFSEILEAYRAAGARIQLSPGLPVPNPSRPLWIDPESPIARHGKGETLEGYADVVIIGSGITGASVARGLLEQDDGDEKGQIKGWSPKRVVILEARETCSGATGRNGGHITPVLYLDYDALKKKHGKAAAQRIIRFRTAHFPALAGAATAYDPENTCTYRATESLDVFYDSAAWDTAKARLATFQADMPKEGAQFEVVEGRSAAERFSLADNALGCIVTTAAAIHPYRFVTKIGEFELYTHTPCTSIAQPTAESSLYTLTTPSGTLTAKHVVHATNGYTSHLLPGLRTKIVPIVGTMSAQRPGATADTARGARSFVFYREALDRGYDYLTQKPDGENELMLGAAFATASLAEVGTADDSRYNRAIAAHLGGALPIYFGEENWGKEGETTQGGGSWWEGRVKAFWSGILGISADGQPWVGRMPLDRPQDGGEWLSAGYTGEGMVHAWLCGDVLARMISGREIPDWFPPEMIVTAARMKKAKIEDIL
ncbi:hypothetical protein PLICRDRAFT_172094 [Plicaturopsis crispa FD-325 SS-3]|nr:hypothetical protein PLICRDRAFT_172094 [Plicaturopsis crispa FD-325 SS-3]